MSTIWRVLAGVCVSVFVHVCLCVCVYLSVGMSACVSKHVRVCACACVSIRVCIRACVCPCMRACVCEICNVSIESQPWALRGPLFRSSLFNWLRAPRPPAEWRVIRRPVPSLRGLSHGFSSPPQEKLHSCSGTMAGLSRTGAGVSLSLP